MASPQAPPSPFSGRRSTDLATVDRLPLERLAQELERIDIPVPPGVAVEAMRVAMKSHITGKTLKATPEETFAEYDSDSSGDLSRAEIALVCASLGDLRGEEGIEEIFAEIDTDGDGTISRAEFNAWWAEEVAPNIEINRRHDRLKKIKEKAKSWEGMAVEEIFAKFDADKSGSLEKAELEELVAALGIAMTSVGMDKLLAELDTDGNGDVSLEEFAAWWKGKAVDWINSGRVPSRRPLLRLRSQDVRWILLLSVQDAPLPRPHRQPCGDAPLMSPPLWGPLAWCAGAVPTRRNRAGADMRVSALAVIRGRGRGGCAEISAAVRVEDLARGEGIHLRRRVRCARLLCCSWRVSNGTSLFIIASIDRIPQAGHVRRRLSPQPRRRHTLLRQVRHDHADRSEAG